MSIFGRRRSEHPKFISRSTGPDLPSGIATSAAHPTDTDELDVLVVEGFERVERGLAAATTAFLAGDRAAAQRIGEDDRALDLLSSRIEEQALERLVLAGGLPSSYVRRLVAILRVAPEIERSGDLVSHIADLGAQGIGNLLSPTCRTLVGRMGSIGVDMWASARRAYLEWDVAAGDRLRLVDDEIDDAHVNLIAELSEAGVSVPVAIQIGLAARYFERVGDHAVNIVRQLSLDAVSS